MKSAPTTAASSTPRPSPAGGECDWQEYRLGYRKKICRTGCGRGAHHSIHQSHCFYCGKPINFKPSKLI